MTGHSRVLRAPRQLQKLKQLVGQSETSCNQAIGKYLTTRCRAIEISYQVCVEGGGGNTRLL